MFYGSIEIDSIADGVATLKNGDIISIPECNMYLLTETPKTASELTEMQVQKTYIDLMPIIGDATKTEEETAKAITQYCMDHDIMVVDAQRVLNRVFERVQKTATVLTNAFQAKEDEAMVKLVGKEKLDARSRIYGATKDVASVSRMSMTVKDLFTL